jgi:mRNA interferase RelE/StbE
LSEGRRAYEIEQIPRAERDLRRLDPQVRQRILAAIVALAEEPRPPGYTNLQGREGYRLRIGDYRVIYEVNDESRTVTVLRVGHRRDVYRQG